MSKFKEYYLKYLIIFTVLISLMIGCKVNDNDNSQVTVKPEWAEWIKNNHQEITNLEADNSDFSDLMFLKSLLEGKRLVQLGENSHGVSEFNKAKVRLIKFLHEIMEYDVIAFESSIFDRTLSKLDIPLQY